MLGRDILIIAAGVLSPWIGLIILVVMHAHSAERLDVLERQLVGLREKVNALIGELGWKEK